MTATLRVFYAAFSTTFVVLGISYMPAVVGPVTLPPALDQITGAIAPYIVGGMWVMIGLLGIGVAILSPLLGWRWPLYVQIVASSMWAALFLVGQIMNGGRAWVSMVTYLRTALILAVVLILVYVVAATLRPLDGHRE